MRAILPTVILLLGVVLAFGTAHAQDRSPIFTVPKVPVFAEAESAAAAQAEAQSQGRKVAMDLLLRRLTAEEDWQYLPRLAGDQPAPAEGVVPADADPEGEGAYQGGGAFPVEDPVADALSPILRKRSVTIGPDDLPPLEQSFAVFDEKTSRTTYRATITYRFKPAEVRRLLSEARLPYSEAQSREALVLPVLETDEGTYLWEAKNPWARAWLARPLVNELTPLVLPRGDQRDVDAIAAPQALRLEAEPLADLAARYGAGQVVIAHGKLSEEDGQFRLYVRLIDGYLDGRGSNRRRIDAGNSRDLYDDAGGFGQGQRATVSAGEPGVVLAEAFFRGRNDDFPALAQRAVESTVATYAKDWKERTLVDHAAVRRFQLTAWFQGLEQWADIRTALEATPLVQDMRTGVFNNENAVIDLSVIGDERQFALAMRQDGLTAWPSATGWNIAEAALAREVQARPEQAQLDAVPRGGGSGGLRRPYDDGRDPEVSYGTNPYGDAPDGGRTYGQEGYDDPEGDQLPELPDELFGPAGGEEPVREERSIDELLIEQL